MSERNIFAVCDLDVDYAYHFMEYLSKKKNIPFEVRVFTSAAGFREYVKEHPVELLLISEKAMNSEIREAKIGQILILSDGVVSKGYEEYPSIYKYQSSNQVIREALEHYGEGVGTTAQTLKLEKKKMEVIGVYSPVGRTMKTTFALTLGQILAKKRAEDGIYCTECQQSGLSAAGTFHGGYPEYHGTGVDQSSAADH